MPAVGRLEVLFPPAALAVLAVEALAPPAAAALVQVEGPPLAGLHPVPYELPLLAWLPVVS